MHFNSYLSILFNVLASGVHCRIRSLCFFHLYAGNIGNVPLVVIAALCRDPSNPFGDSEICARDGNAYISFGQWVCKSSELMFLNSLSFILINIVIIGYFLFLSLPIFFRYCLFLHFPTQNSDFALLPPDQRKDVS